MKTKMFSFYLLVGGMMWSCTLNQLHAQEYIWTTIVGLAGTGGTNDGWGDTARFWFPCGIAMGPNGMAYVADTGNETIRELELVGTNWLVSTIAGLAGGVGTNDGPGTNARFFSPQSIALDGLGQLYIADNGNYTIRKLAPNGLDWVVTTIAGRAGVFGRTDGLGDHALFAEPNGIGVDPGGNVFVADGASALNHLIPNSAIRRITAVGEDWLVGTPIGGPISGHRDGTNNAARFEVPDGLAVDARTNLYVAEHGKGSIRKVEPIGTNWVASTLAGANGIGSADGTNTTAQFYGPEAIAVGHDGNLYVADTQNHTIRKMTLIGTNWVVSTVGGLAGNLGTADGAGSAARFHAPMGIAVDGFRNIYVADTYNHAIRFGRCTLALDAVLAGNQLVLSWPKSAIDFELETCSTLSPLSSWTSVTHDAEIQGEVLIVTNQCGSSSAFYRLRRR